jgi:hypothetical protein
MKKTLLTVIIIGILLWTAGVHAQQTNQLSRPPLPKPGPTVAEDCVSFNPAAASVENVQNNWSIVDGGHGVFSFGSNQAEARQTLAILKNYGMNQSCFVGRPQPSFQYTLVSGRAPAGSMTGEDCLSFNPATATVSFIQNDWKIVDGNHAMFSFGSRETEARQTLAIIKKHNFNSSCFVGRPNPSFTYMKAAGTAAPSTGQQPVRPVTGTIATGVPATVTGTLPVPAKSDLQADRIWIAQYVPPANVTQYAPLSGNPKPGQEVYLVCEFHNAGSDLKGNWRVSWQVDGKEVYTTRFGDIEAGGKRNPGARYLMPATGAHRYECVLDPDGQIAEANEANNRASGTFQVAAATQPATPTLPDLKVTRVWLAQYTQNVTQYTPLSTSPVPGQQVYLVCEFENAGADLKGTFRLAWLIDGVQVATTSFGDMPAGMKRNPAGRYTISVSPGSHKVECVLDADNKINELNEQNNRAGITFDVAHAAVPATPPAGSTGSTSGSTGPTSYGTPTTQGSTPAAGAPVLSSMTPTGALINARLSVTGKNLSSIPGSTVVIQLQSGEQFTGVPENVTATQFTMAPVPDVYKGYNVTAKNNEHRARIQQLKFLYLKKGSTESNRLTFNIRSPYPILDQVYNPTAKPGDVITVRGGNFEPAKITQYTAVFEYLPGKTIQAKPAPLPTPAPAIPFPYLPDVTMVGNFIVKVPDVFAGKSQADQDAINRYTGTVAISGPGTALSNKLPFGFRKTSSPSSASQPSTGTGNTCQAGKYLSGMTYVGQPGCATGNRADHPSAYLMCDAQGFYCCESAQGANTKCGANRWMFQPDCGNYCGVGGCDVQLIQPNGCYRSNPK